ncbi:MAG: hypothetical protein N2504_01095 [candidate division WOR-3 bacterium]|nr:hypothetical protein [candidate division WOR-3 bacterium]
MFNEILHIHFKKWLETIQEENPRKEILMENTYLDDFFEKRKNLMNSSHIKFIEKIRNGFSGIFEVLGYEENNLKLKNYVNNETIYIKSVLKSIKYDILIGRVYEDENGFHLVEEISEFFPYLYRKKIDLNESPYRNYLKLKEIIAKKCWDGFECANYYSVVKISDIKRFKRVLQSLNCLARLENKLVIYLGGELARNIRRNLIRTEEDITHVVWGIMNFVNEQIVIYFQNINLAKTFLELLKKVINIENFYIEESGNYRRVNLEEEFNSQYRENEILDFYHSKKDWGEEELKFYYNLEGHFKKIGARNYLEIFQNYG